MPVVSRRAGPVAPLPSARPYGRELIPAGADVVRSHLAPEKARVMVLTLDENPRNALMYHINDLESLASSIE